MKMDEAVKSSVFHDQQNKEDVESEVFPERDNGADSENVGTVNETVEDSAVTSQYTS